MSQSIANLSPGLDDMISELSGLEEDDFSTNVSFEDAYEDDINSDDSTQDIIMGVDDDCVLDESSHQDLKDHALSKEMLMEQAKFSIHLCEQLESIETDDSELNKELNSSVLALEELILKYGELDAFELFISLYELISEKYSPDACGLIHDIMRTISSSDRLPILSDRVIDSPEHVTLVIQRQLYHFLEAFETDHDERREIIHEIMTLFQANAAIDDIRIG